MSPWHDPGEDREDQVGGQRPQRQGTGDTEGLQQRARPQEDGAHMLGECRFPPPVPTVGHQHPDHLEHRHQPHQPGTGCAIVLPECSEGQVGAGQEQADAGPQHHSRQVGGVQEAIPEGSAGQPFAGRQHEGDNPLDHHQGHEGREGVQPDEPEMGAGPHPVPGGVVGQGRCDFQQEEHPLDGPSPDEGPDQCRGGGRMHQADGHPDSHTADGPEYRGDQDQHQRRPPRQLP